MHNCSKQGKLADIFFCQCVLLLSLLFFVVVIVQFATSMKEVLDNWNINTALWLRRYAYQEIEMKYLQAPRGSGIPLFIAHFPARPTASDE